MVDRTSWLDVDGVRRRLSELATEDVGGGTTSRLPYHLQLEREHEREAGPDGPPGFSEMIRANIGDLTPPELRDFLQGARALLLQHAGELPADDYITRDLAKWDHHLVEAEHRARVARARASLVLVACALKLCVLAARARRRHHAPGGAGARHTAASWAAGVAAQAMTQAGRA